MKGQQLFGLLGRVGNIRNEESLVGDLNGFEKLAALQVRFVVEVLLGVSSVKVGVAGETCPACSGRSFGQGSRRRPRARSRPGRIPVPCFRRCVSHVARQPIRRKRSGRVRETRRRCAGYPGLPENSLRCGGLGRFFVLCARSETGGEEGQKESGEGFGHGQENKTGRRGHTFSNRTP
jgi:hypothetical protein